jgi:hypothetical protein
MRKRKKCPAEKRIFGAPLPRLEKALFYFGCPSGMKTWTKKDAFFARFSSTCRKDALAVFFACLPVF